MTSTACFIVLNGLTPYLVELPADSTLLKLCDVEKCSAVDPLIRNMELF